MTSKSATAEEPKIHHIGADVPMDLFRQLKAKAEEDGVPYTVIIRWALQDFLAVASGAGASQ